MINQLWDKKINNTTIKSYKIVTTIFLIINYTKKVRFFKKSFLIVNVSLNIIFNIFFLL